MGGTALGSVNHLGAFALLLGSALMLVPPALAESNGPVVESTALGAYEYRTYCASCHGASGRGDGALAGQLKVAPIDLTLLAKNNDGRLPRERLGRVIDGRQEVLAHGSREMPVWGDWFNRELLREELFGEELRNLSIKTRIDGLMTYIEALQAK